MSMRIIDKFEPMDVIAIVIIGSCLAALKIKPDSTFKDVLLIITGFYFGAKTYKNGNR